MGRVKDLGGVVSSDSKKGRAGVMAHIAIRSWNGMAGIVI